MADLLLSLSFLGAVVVTHLLWCRARGGHKLHFVAFGVISMAGLTGLCVILWASAAPDGALTVWTLPLPATAIVLYIFLLPFYQVFYYSTMIDSPSRRIISLLRQRGPMHYDDLRQEITNDRFIMTRLNPLIKHGFVRFDGREYFLKPRALLTCRLLILYQKILGRGIGG